VARLLVATQPRDRKHLTDPRRPPATRPLDRELIGAITSVDMAVAGPWYTSRMKTMSLLAAGAAAATFAVPSTAAAAPGWELPQASSFIEGNRELPNTTYATHCGRSQYGLYRFRIGVTQRGIWGGVRFRVQLTADGAGHAATRVRFVGRMSRPLERQIRELLRTVVFRVNGNIVQTVFTATGQQQTSLAFAPRPRRC
jgi:hypothetical protein